jgi:hypothetical protein
MADFNKIYLYRMTHIANVPHVSAHGITHRNSPFANPNFTPIGDPTLISTRDEFVLDNGRTLGEYIPFYFGTRTPMLFKIQKGLDSLVATPPEKIVYIVTSAQQIIEQESDFVFTDGHAVDKFSSQYLPNEIGMLEELLDFKAIKAKYWKDENDLDKKRRKQAEFLLFGDLPFASILGFIVYNETAKIQLLQFGVAENQIHINTNAYF